MKKYWWICLPVMVLFLPLLAYFATSQHEAAVTSADGGWILIDPGHGGLTNTIH